MVDFETSERNRMRRLKIGQDSKLNYAYDIIKDNFNEITADAIVDTEDAVCVIKYASLLNRKNEDMPTLNDLLDVEEITNDCNICKIDEYITLKDYQKFQKKIMKMNLSIQNLDKIIRSKQQKSGKAFEGDGELFLNNNFQHDMEKRNGGDFYWKGLKFEVKTNGSRLRGSNGFGNLGSVRTQIIREVKAEKWINQKLIRDLCKQNETQTWETKKKKGTLNGHLFFFPEENKKYSNRKYFIPSVYECLANKSEKEKFKNIIYSAFCNHLYNKLISLHNKKLQNDLKNVIDLMLKNDIKSIAEEWKDWNAEYYWTIEGKPIMIFFNEVDGLYDGFYITNDIEAFKHHIAPAKHPSVKNSSSQDAGWAVTYRPINTIIN